MRSSSCLQAQKAADREAEKAAKEAEKEAEKAAKEAEREAGKAAKEAEREAERAAKEAERERRHKEAEVRPAAGALGGTTLTACMVAWWHWRLPTRRRPLPAPQAARLAKKTGFKDAQQLSKTASKFANFFKPKAAATTPGAPGAASQASSLLSGGGGGGCGSASAAKGSSPVDAPGEQALLESAMDRASSAGLTPEAAAAEWQALLARTKAGRAAAAAARVPGLPPTWARRADAAQVAAAAAQALADGGVGPGGARAWRRKFVWFPADSARPPYYGSWPAAAAAAPAPAARRPFGREETVDYEVMSDLEWEEEPEGEAGL